MFTHQQSLATRFPFLRFNGEGGDGGGGGGEGTPGAEGGTPPPAYTAPQSQADLDRIVEARLARERQKLASEYGGDAASVKAQLAEYEKYKESQKTETEKAIDEAKKGTETEVSQRFLSRLVGSEVKALAASLGFNDPADALAVIDSASLPVKDDEPDTDAIKKLVEKLATDKPYLLKAGTKPTPRVRPKPGQGDPTDTPPAGGKGNAASALRQLATRRKGS
ncbi:hypothetical protein J7E68_01605 [Microbacterium sp. ISL-103]|uniref:hypothetical protein n=1 Tax=Microbacterium sp. ISL-103 TaxID=2819156 RepID=UPI001BEA2D33|nr:hypothetical protein [Microbacterium sp. ISL-103]MBT2473303.1 hypothetical protein [Microbacterium sp. ISL-103]